MSDINTTLHIKLVPDALNTEMVMRRHFEQFGTITYLQCRTDNKSTRVAFASRSEAKAAKDVGKVDVLFLSFSLFFKSNLLKSERL